MVTLAPSSCVGRLGPTKSAAVQRRVVPARLAPLTVTHEPCENPGRKLPPLSTSVMRGVVAGDPPGRQHPVTVGSRKKKLKRGCSAGEKVWITCNWTSCGWRRFDPVDCVIAEGDPLESRHGVVD